MLSLMPKKDDSHEKLSESFYRKLDLIFILINLTVEVQVTGCVDGSSLWYGLTYLLSLWHLWHSFLLCVSLKCRWQYLQVRSTSNRVKLSIAFLVFPTPCSRSNEVKASSWTVAVVWGGINVLRFLRSDQRFMRTHLFVVWTSHLIFC